MTYKTTYQQINLTNMMNEEQRQTTKEQLFTCSNWNRRATADRQRQALINLGLI